MSCKPQPPRGAAARLVGWAVVEYPSCSLPWPRKRIGGPAGHHRPAHRRAADAARRKFHDRHQRRENRQGNRRHAAAGLALDREAARAGRAREGPSAHRLSHRARARTFWSPQMLSHRLYGTPFARRIYHFFKTDSTNSGRHATWANTGEPHGAVVLAEEQTAGRGRAGRSWHSEKSAGIYCSDPAAAADFARARAAAHAGCRARRARRRCRRARRRFPTFAGRTICWSAARKFCGILTEMHAEPDRMHYAVVGIGINVNQTKMPAGPRGHRHVAAHGDGQGRIRASNC